MCFCIRSYNAIEELRGKNGNSLSTNAGCNVLLILTLQLEITILFLFVCFGFFVLLEKFHYVAGEKLQSLTFTMNSWPFRIL